MIENNINNFDGTLIGTVLESDQKTRKVAVYIPKLMPALSDISSQNQKVITNTNNKDINIDFEPFVTKRNSIWLFPLNASEALPKKNSKVKIEFLENNPKLGFWSLFNPNNDYDVIEEEKYPKSFKIVIDSNSVDINKDDELILNFPDHMKATIFEDKKNKTINLFSDGISGSGDFSNGEVVFSTKGIGKITTIQDENGFFKYSLDNGKTFKTIKTDTIDDSTLVKTLVQNFSNSEKTQVRKNIDALGEEDLPTKLSDLDNDMNFLDNTVNNLLNYYLKTEIYSKEEVSRLFSAISSLSFEIVDELPEENINSSKIYLITIEDSNSYEQWIHIGDMWENIGTTDMDLTGFVPQTRRIAAIPGNEESGLSLEKDITRDELLIALHPFPDWNIERNIDISETEIDAQLRGFIKNKPDLTLKADKVEGKNLNDKIALLDEHGNLKAYTETIEDYKDNFATTAQGELAETAVQIDKNDEIIPEDYTLKYASEEHPGIIEIATDEEAGEGVNTSFAVTPKHLADLSETILTTMDSNYVPKTRTINDLELSSDIELTPSDIGAIPLERTVAGISLENDIEISSLRTALNVEDGAEVNVQSDWNVTESTSAAFINNKPDLTLKVDKTQKIAGLELDGDLSISDIKSALSISNVEDGAEVNVQSNWNEDDSNDDAFILNKPTTLKNPKEFKVFKNTEEILGWTYDGSEERSLNIVTTEEANSAAGFVGEMRIYIPEQVQSDWNISDTSKKEYIKNKPNLALELSGKIDKIPAVEGIYPEGNFPIISDSGGLLDSGLNENSFLTPTVLENDYLKNYVGKSGITQTESSNYGVVKINTDGLVIDFSETLLEMNLPLLSNLSTFRTSFQENPDDLHFISEKLAYDSLEGKVSTSTTIAGEKLESNISKTNLLNALNVEDGAQVNVQSDWSEDDDKKDSFILNKPTVLKNPFSLIINDISYDGSEEKTISGLITKDVDNLTYYTTTSDLSDLLNDKADDSALSDEIEAREEADEALQEAIDDEIEAREEADEALQEAIDLKADDTDVVKTIAQTLSTTQQAQARTNIGISAAGTGILNTTNTTTLTPSSNESFSGTINLHKISKTGDYNDLLNLPDLTALATEIELTYDFEFGKLTLDLKNDSTIINSDNIILPYIDGGEIKTCLVDETPVGFSAGDKYLELTYFGFPLEHVYIPMNSFVIKLASSGTGNAVTDISLLNNELTLKKEKTFVETSRTINNLPLSSDITLAPSDIGAADDSSVVHKSGVETIDGIKTFEATINSSSILPRTTSTFNLGSSDFKYKNLHLSGNSFIDGNITLSSTSILTDGTDSTTIENIVTKIGTQIISGGKTFSSALYSNSILPLNNNEGFNYNLGSSELKWKNLYLAGDAVIGGNLTISGSSTIVNSTNLSITDKLILIAKDNTVALTSPAGLVASKYNGINDGALVFDNSGTAFVGDVILDINGEIDLTDSGTSLQPIATRDSSLLMTGLLPYWDSIETKLKTIENGSEGDVLTIKTDLDENLILSWNDPTKILVDDANFAYEAGKTSFGLILNDDDNLITFDGSKEIDLFDWYIDLSSSQIISGEKTFENISKFSKINFGNDKWLSFPSNISKEDSEIITTETIATPLTKGIIKGYEYETNISLGANSLKELYDDIKNNPSDPKGEDNIALGIESGKNLILGKRNIFLGNSSEIYTTNGNDNIAIGDKSFIDTFGSGNILLGNLTEVIKDILPESSRNIAIGYGSIVGNKNSIQIGSGKNITSNTVQFGGSIIGQEAYEIKDLKLYTRLDENDDFDYFSVSLQNRAETLLEKTLISPILNNATIDSSSINFSILNSPIIKTGNNNQFKLNLPEITKDETIAVKSEIFEFENNSKIWTGNIAESFSGGNGTEKNPYLIKNGEELALLAAIINSEDGIEGETKYSTTDYIISYCRTAYYKLIENIVLNKNSENYNNSNIWIESEINIFPGIGKETGSGDYSFKGNFNGNNFSIKGLYIGSSAEFYSYKGLFSSIIDGEVSNLTIENSVSNGAVNTGLLAGKIKNTTIFNVGIKQCSLNTSFSGGSQSEKCGGGLVGAAENSSIKNSFAYFHMSSFIDSGIVGKASLTVIENCCSIIDHDSPGSTSYFGITSQYDNFENGEFTGDATNIINYCFSSAQTLIENSSFIIDFSLRNRQFNDDSFETFGFFDLDESKFVDLSSSARNKTSNITTILNNYVLNKFNNSERQYNSWLQQNGIKKEERFPILTLKNDFLKVDKVIGKGLSQEDFTSELKADLESLYEEDIYGTTIISKPNWLAVPGSNSEIENRPDFSLSGSSFLNGILDLNLNDAANAINKETSVNLKAKSQSFGVLYGISDIFEESGENNTGLGYGTLFNMIRGTENLGLGINSLNSLIEGSKNIAIGHNADIKYSVYEEVSSEIIREAYNGKYLRSGISPNFLYTEITNETENIEIGITQCFKLINGIYEEFKPCNGYYLRSGEEDNYIYTLIVSNTEIPSEATFYKADISNSIALGWNAKIEASNAIQIGTGKNETSNTAQLGGKKTFNGVNYYQYINDLKLYTTISDSTKYYSVSLQDREETLSRKTLSKPIIDKIKPNGSSFYLSIPGIESDDSFSIDSKTVHKIGDEIIDGTKTFKESIKLNRKDGVSYIGLESENSKLVFDNNGKLFFGTTENLNLVGAIDEDAGDTEIAFWDNTNKILTTNSNITISNDTIKINGKNVLDEISQEYTLFSDNWDTNKKQKISFNSSLALDTSSINEVIITGEHQEWFNCSVNTTEENEYWIEFECKYEPAKDLKFKIITKNTMDMSTIGT